MVIDAGALDAPGAYEPLIGSILPRPTRRSSISPEPDGPDE